MVRNDVAPVSLGSSQSASTGETSGTAVCGYSPRGRRSLAATEDPRRLRTRAGREVRLR